jgi:HSP20 family protein
MPLVSFRGLDPLDGLQSLQREIERLFRSPAAGFGLGPAAAGVFPPVNAFTDGEGVLVVRAEVPGISPDRIDVQVEPRRLVVSGERTLPQSGGGFHRRERRGGHFARTIQIPEDVDPEAATAEVKNGVLTIRIPRREVARPRRVAVQAS